MSSEALVDVGLNDIIIVNKFDQDKGKIITYYNFRVLFSLMKNLFAIKTSTTLEPQGIRLMIDGSYKLIRGDFCILVYGTSAIVLSKVGEVTQTFRPIVFALVP